MTSYKNVIEITNQFGIEVILCSNAETLLDGHDIDDCDYNDTTSQVVRAMRDALYDRTGELVDDSRTFSDWHGKHWDRSLSRVACRTLTRSVSTDEDGEAEYGDWKWIAFSQMPCEVKVAIDDILDVADDAGINKIVELENAKETKS